MKEYFVVNDASVEEHIKMREGRFKFDEDLSMAGAGLRALNPVVQDCERLISGMRRDTVTLHLGEFFSSELAVAKAAFAAAEAQLSRLHRIRRAVVHLDVLTDSRLSQCRARDLSEQPYPVSAESLEPIRAD